MKPAPFAYVDPHTLTDTLQALAEHGEEGKLLAGGQSLVPLMNMRLSQPEVIIDLNRVPGLDGIEPRCEAGRAGVAIGAMTRQQSASANNIVKGVPLLAQALEWVGHTQIRNRGTVGGSIAHADPAAELPLAFRALDGIATVRSTRGCRQVAASDFFVYAMTPALDADEMLTEIWLPLPPPRTGHAFLEVARRHGDFALVAAAVSITVAEDGTIASATIGIGGAAATPLRATAAERYLAGRHGDEQEFHEAAALAAADTEPTSDVHADARYRAEIAETLVERALAQAFGRVSGRQG